MMHFDLILEIDYIHLDYNKVYSYQHLNIKILSQISINNRVQHLKVTTWTYWDTFKYITQIKNPIAFEKNFFCLKKRKDTTFP